MNDIPISEMNFEQAMNELERIVTQLERGDVPLEDSIALYERGAELKKRCEVKEFYLQTTQVRGREDYFVEDYQPPKKNFTYINTNNSEEETFNEILNVCG